MRVVLAYDGSAGADQACDLLAHLALPDATSITVVGVLQPLPIPSAPGALPGGPPEAEGHLMADLGSKLEAAARGLAAPGRTVEHRVLRGRPADAIVAEATRLDADLIVIGSRGYGPFKSALLGSVSTEVVNASSRPVLVARGADVRRMVLATDGTDTSARALDLVAAWPMFADLEITVVSVSEPPPLWGTMDPAATSPYLVELEMALADDSRAVHAEMARAAAARLREAGRSARDEVRIGNPAHQIVQAAEEAGADLIVTGSRRGSAALPGAIGSVARNVLHNARTSVLVVREPMTAAASRAAREDLAADAGQQDEP